ncbi:hypothetical protein Bhyg_09694 [Pseudolycoriella hygida]|uniref:Uncharacterized protein n=1 Tax=Pseudolycoriella hygida TaxID=35572 RepID=A0A9Q0MS04_9DIPT|nr:hypothetical protein Bhyg_09694 [Pseudolycoriella hygida]
MNAVQISDADNFIARNNRSLDQSLTILSRVRAAAAILTVNYAEQMHTPLSVQLVVALIRKLGGIVYVCHSPMELCFYDVFRLTGVNTLETTIRIALSFECLWVEIIRDISKRCNTNERVITYIAFRLICLYRVITSTLGAEYEGKECTGAEKGSAEVVRGGEKSASEIACGIGGYGYGGEWGRDLDEKKSIE